MLSDANDHEETRLLVLKYYRPWTFSAWRYRKEVGVKLGPVTLAAYLWGWRPNVAVSLLGRWTLDTLWTD